MKRILIFVFVLILAVSNVNALVKGSCVTAEVSDVSPSSIGVDEEFTISVQIENCGEELPEIVSFELINPPVDIEIKEPLIINVSRLYYGNSERTIIYHMKTIGNAFPGEHLIKTRLIYGKEGNLKIKDYNITIDVLGDSAELNIASLKTNPVLPREGDVVELTMRIENTGDGTAKSVNVYVDHDFEGIKQSFIGALESDEDGPAVFTFIVDKSGEFELPIIISYKDDFGEQEINTAIKINVLKKKSNALAIFISILLVVIFAWGVYYFIKIKKAKDEVIHQLLKENNVKQNRKDNKKSGESIIQKETQKIKEFFVNRKSKKRKK